jgi:hypothetical protein
MKQTSASFLLALAITAGWARPAAADSPNDDVTPPEVSITAPADQETFDGAPAMVTISVAATDPDIPNEWNSGVESVTVTIDGEALAADDSAPYEWADVELAEGMHELVATAIDGSGNQASSTPIHVAVFPADGETGGDGTGSEGGDGNGDGDGGGDGEASSKGCSVSPVQRRNAFGSVIAFAFAVFSASMLRRRRKD